MLPQKLKQTALVTALMLASFTAGVTLQPVLAESAGFSVFLQVFDLVKMEYVEKKVEDKKLVRGAIQGMLTVLDDPYTRYITPEEFQQMREERQGSFSGIGIQIGTRNNQLTVIAPIEDTPAWKAGLKAGDIIQALDGKSAEGMAVDDAVNIIRGKEGSPIVLTIYRTETKKKMDVTVVRGKIETKVVKSKMKGDKIGYIRLTSFMNENADTEVRDALTSLKKQGMKALILDLRSNPGGLLTNAITIGSLFVEKGPIVRIVDRDGKEELQNASGKLGLDANVPMAVLIDGGSASASEILAGTLKDNKRAVLIGKKSFGKGLVQTVHNLSDGSGVAITTNKYLTSHGTDINKKGIMPDIEVSLPKELMEQAYDETKDSQLLKAMQVMAEKMAHK